MFSALYRTPVSIPSIRSLIAPLAASIVLAIAGCAPKGAEAVVASVGDQDITVADYERMYVKSNGSREAGEKATAEEREKFLELMVKYRLKLADAYRDGLDTRPEVVSELQQYKGSLAESFLTDREVVQPGVKDFYARRREEIRASHILLELGPSASPADSAAAYAKAAEVIAQAKAGTDFSTLATQLSKDPSAARNGGDLYYFTAGQMVPAFENAAFAMKVGEISQAPVRTQYGLHIIKVVDRRPAPGEVRSGHIMIRFPTQNPTPDDTAAAYAKVRAIRDSLVAGADFAELATRNSEDPGSAPRGGDLGWFTRRRWILPFDEVAMAMKPGDLSGIVRTVYGYHIIKCFEVRPPKGFEESKQELRQLYQQQRFPDDFKAYFATQQVSVGFRRDEAVTAQFLASLDSTKSTRDSGWASTVTPALRAAPMCWLGTTPISVDSVLSLLKARPDLTNVQLKAAPMTAALQKVQQQIVFSAVADRLQRENPEFASLMSEYRDGILLYQVEQDNVWSRIAPEDSTLRAFYDANASKFAYGERVRFSELKGTTEANGRVILARLRAGKSMADVAAEDSARMQLPSRFSSMFKPNASAMPPPVTKMMTDVTRQMTADTLLRARITIRPDTSSQKEKRLALAKKRLEGMKAWLQKKAGVPETRIVIVSLPRKAPGRGDSVEVELVNRSPIVQGKVESHLLAASADERARRADSLALNEYSSPFFHKSGFSIVRLEGREPARPKTYQEAGPEVSTAFQDYESKRLESAWIDGLRRDFEVVEHPEVLQSAFAPTQ
jgi:peptidyl-prolyl cis-trans isomerase SurA